MPPIFSSHALLRLLALSACAALFALEHLRLAVAAARRERWSRGALALLVPLAGPAMAWRRGERFAAVAYAALAAGYVLLRAWPGGG